MVPRIRLLSIKFSTPQLFLFSIALTPHLPLLELINAFRIMAFINASLSKALTSNSLKTRFANKTVNGKQSGSLLFQHKYLWLAIRDRIPSNVNRCKRRIAHDPTCIACSAAEESSIHLLRDCHAVRKLWIFDLQVGDWIFKNLTINTCHPAFGVPWNVLFAYLIWHTWKRRNEQIFNGTRRNADSILHQSLSLAKHALPLQAIRLLADMESSATAGGVIRDHLGNFLFGFNRNLGSATWAHGFEKVQLQTYSLDAFQLINKASPDSSYPMICKMVADFLAKFDASANGNLTVFDTTTAPLDDLLLHASQDPPYVRFGHA
ncbi:hypothetical protein F3Y22_tig00016212pilonHSYRG00084 [Hibiscus syriacus]|uniref:Reverse transcriptase zinc-binding domain-containing protein n=1 Tax=Hibiscus syriacus TaxID=106335 RepID=A0A6A3BWY8_HIBSY|nr:hypothetical protein F3Y22_tig00016212pilonHSYRG00084 [Hibiscus syriacus]